jgi:DNA-binding MarR family transcriptional regulator
MSDDIVMLDGTGGRRGRRLRAALAIVRMRSVRDRMLGQKISFADPAWDLLLDLYVAELRGPTLSVSDACVGARVPATTALRWLNHLHAAGAIERIPDPRDKRRVMLRLTPGQISRLDDFFDELIASTSSTEARSNRSSNSPSA